MSGRILYPRDQRRHGQRALLRLEVADDEVTVVVHEVGPPVGNDDERHDRWHQWVQTLAPPVLADDTGLEYPLRTSIRPWNARGPGGNPRQPQLSMKATVSWVFARPSTTAPSIWRVDEHWDLPAA